MTGAPGGGALERLRAVVRPTREVIGWGTVDLDRTIADLVDGHAVEVTDDPHLGAYSRRIVGLEPSAGMGGETEAILLEPSTEGPLAATLARHGEGVVARYLVAPPGAIDAARSGGIVLSAPAPGPLGQQRLVLGGSRFGPHLLLVDADPQRDGGGQEAGTADTIEA